MLSQLQHIRTILYKQNAAKSSIRTMRGRQYRQLFYSVAVRFWPGGMISMQSVHKQQLSLIDSQIRWLHRFHMTLRHHIGCLVPFNNQIYLHICFYVVLQRSKKYFFRYSWYLHTISNTSAMIRLYYKENRVSKGNVEHTYFLSPFKVRLVNWKFINKLFTIKIA